MPTSVHLWRPRLNVTSQEVCGGGGGGAYLFRGHAINYGKSPKRLMYDGDPASPAHGHTHTNAHPGSAFIFHMSMFCPKLLFQCQNCLLKLAASLSCTSITQSKLPWSRRSCPSPSHTLLILTHTHTGPSSNNPSNVNGSN